MSERSKVHRRAARKKMKEDSAFDGRFFERVEEKPEHYLSEEEAIQLGLKEYFHEEEETGKKEEETSTETHTEDPDFNPFKQKLQ